MIKNLEFGLDNTTCTQIKATTCRGASISFTRTRTIKANVALQLTPKEVVGGDSTISKPNSFERLPGLPKPDLPSYKTKTIFRRLIDKVLRPRF